MNDVGRRRVTEGGSNPSDVDYGALPVMQAGTRTKGNKLQLVCMQITQRMREITGLNSPNIYTAYSVWSRWKMLQGLMQASKANFAQRNDVGLLKIPQRSRIKVGTINIVSSMQLRLPAGCPQRNVAFGKCLQLAEHDSRRAQKLHPTSSQRLSNISH
jgi:hypothetical protein